MALESIKMSPPPDPRLRLRFWRDTSAALWLVEKSLGIAWWELGRNHPPTVARKAPSKVVGEMLLPTV